MAATGELVTGGLIINGDALTATVTSNTVIIERCHVASLQVVMTSGSDTAAGAISVQGSNDNSNWVSLAFTDGTSTVTSVSYDLSAAEVNKLFNLENIGCKYLRVSITATSTGAADTVQCWAHVKNRS